MYLLIGIAALGLLLFIRGLFLENARKKEDKQRLRKSFGKRSEKKYTPQRYASLKEVLSVGKEEQKALLDEASWKDLGMDDVFLSMDSCNSFLGEEALYFRLHNMHAEDSSLFHKCCEDLRDEEEIRVFLQCILKTIGRSKRISFPGYLSFLDNTKKSPLWPHFFGFLGYAGAIALSCFYPVPGLVVGIIVVAVQILSYLREKQRMLEALLGISCIVRIAGAGKKLGSLSCDRDELGKRFLLIRERSRALEALSGGFSVIIAASNAASGHNGGNNPLELLFLYLNMLFHFDLILFERILGEYRKHRTDILELAREIGELDSAAAVASWELSLGRDVCIPAVSEEYDTLTVVEGYHPLLKNPVSNSFSQTKGILLTGSNASGKSTFLRMSGICVLLAQTIGVVPAKEYRGPHYEIITSIKHEDRLETKESYFLAEIHRFKEILAKADNENKKFVLVDEVLRGTNTSERIAAAKVLLEYIEKRGMLVFAATHDLELTVLLDSSFDNYHFEENCLEGDIIFSSELKEGPSNTRNAIALLGTNGFPEHLVKDAFLLASVIDGSREKSVY